MSEHDSDIRRVRRVLEEVKAAHLPTIQWKVLEQELFSELEGQEPGVRGRRRSQPRSQSARGWWVLGAAAAVVFALFGVNELRQRDRLRSALPSPAPQGSTWTQKSVRSSETNVGDHFVASRTAITITDTRLGQWTLAPGGEATLLKRDPVVVQLEHGELLAEITPGLGPEVFAVHAAQARIAVKGTVFRVQRQLDRVHVQVERGSVSVSSLGGGKQAFELRAPASGDFALDAASGRVWEPEATGTFAESGAKSRLPRNSGVPKKPLPVPAPEAAAENSSLSPTPTVKQVDTGLDALIFAASECLSDTVSSNGQVSLTLVTQARLSVSPLGSLTRLDLTPPLSPRADVCLRGKLQAISFGPSLNGAELLRRLELTVSPRKPSL